MCNLIKVQSQNETTVLGCSFCRHPAHFEALWVAHARLSTEHIPCCHQKNCLLDYAVCFPPSSNVAGGGTQIASPSAIEIMSPCSTYQPSFLIYRSQGNSSMLGAERQLGLFL
jgi:hypothetical protein